MEIKDNEFQTLQDKVNQLSSELDKQNTVRVVNTKWMIIVGVVILSALGFTSFYKIPNEADSAAIRAVEEKIDNDIMNKAETLERIYDKVKESDLIIMPIGTIIPSMLKPELFKKQYPYSDKWVLAMGQKVSTEWEYYKEFGDESPIPDLRGMFLRGMNVNGGQDPDVRSAGSPQEDALKKHEHNTTATELGSEKLTVKWPPYGKDKQYGYTEDGYARKASVTTEGANASTETRPKNVAVYFYIKIN